MMSAWVTDVCALATLCFIIEQLFLIAFMFMFNVLQIHLHTLKKPNQTKKPTEQKTEKYYELFPPLPQIKTFFFNRK